MIKEKMLDTLNSVDDDMLLDTYDSMQKNGRAGNIKLKMIAGYTAAVFVLAVVVCLLLSGMHNERKEISLRSFNMFKSKLDQVLSEVGDIGNNADHGDELELGGQAVHVEQIGIDDIKNYMERSKTAWIGPEVIHKCDIYLQIEKEESIIRVMVCEGSSAVCASCSVSDFSLIEQWFDEYIKHK